VEFLKDAVDLERLEPVAHTAFRADVSTLAVESSATTLQHGCPQPGCTDRLCATQAFARVAREANLGGIVYQSVRDPHPAWCMALLTPQAFAKPQTAPDDANLVARRASGPSHLAPGEQSMTFSAPPGNSRESNLVAEKMRDNKINSQNLHS